MEDKLIKLREEYLEKSRKFDQSLLKITIKGNGEKFVFLPDLFKGHSLNVFFTKREGAAFYLRESVGKALLKAVKFFNKKGLGLKIESAYRSLTGQKTLFEERFVELKHLYPAMGKEELLHHANTFTAGIPVLAAHTAGAAVDVLVTDRGGAPLDFGVDYRYGDIESITEFSLLSEEAKTSRLILKEGMERFGFVNYPFEYWHFSIGDVCAAYLSGEKVARFDPVELNLDTLEAIPMEVGKTRRFFEF